MSQKAKRRAKKAGGKAAARGPAKAAAKSASEVTPGAAVPAQPATKPEAGRVVIRSAAATPASAPAAGSAPAPGPGPAQRGRRRLLGSLLDAESSEGDEAQREAREQFAASLVNDPVLRTITQPALALIFLLTLLLFWRGHQLPGGGFVGGAMMACALLLYRIVNGRNPTDFNFTRLIPVGLVIAFLTGLVPYLTGRAFLKSDYGYLTTPLTGEFEWATALLFDTGVFLVVIGGIMTIATELIAIRPSERVEEER